MWHTNFADRLEAWTQLRTKIATLDVEPALDLVNKWWYNAPWKPYYLHWDDKENWPDPWQLLSDNVFCELARGLGILYTISMIDHPDIPSAKLVLTEDERNLVLVNKTKYILNYNQEVIVNTRLTENIKKSFTLEEVKQKYN
jgi:hypothetical protein